MQQDHLDVPAAPDLKTILRWTAAALLLIGLYAQFCGLEGEPLKLFVLQDRMVILIDAACLLALSFVSFRIAALRPKLTLLHVLAGAAALALLLWAGTYAVMGNYAFTRDEHMAVFDAAIFAEGRYAAPVAVEWRAFVRAMEPLYALSFADNAAWASAYLPGNAGLRALFSRVLDPALMNPALAGVGAILLFLAARRLFPASRSAQAIALLIYATSAQMALNAMTPFAMTAHMTFNLLWLVLFLRGGRAGHAGAAATGFLAVGIHQIVFHPLFALPFLEYLRRRREYSTAIFYLIVYIAAGLFWMSYYGLIGGGVVAVPSSGAAPGLSGFINDRILPLLATRDPATLALMDFNLVRFVAWQNLALIPLLLCGIGAARRGEGVAAPLYWGILLTIGAMFILLPFQSIGWGYRYLHGLLGSFALLAAYGWQRVEGQQAARPLLLFGTLVTLCAAAPYLFWQAHAFVKPSIEANRFIDKLDTDFVVIDSDDVGLARDQVRNDPFLRNRPLRLSSMHLRRSDMDLLCARGSLSLVSRERLAAFGIIPDAPADRRRFPILAERVAGRPCLKT